MKNRPFIASALLLLVVLGFLFRATLTPGGVVASNDAPLGMMQAATDDRWENFWNGSWANLNWLGTPSIGTMPNISHGSYVILGAMGFSKFYAPIGLLALGLAALYFCRHAGFHPWVGTLMAIAAALNTDIFSHACWGLASRATVVASILFALGTLLKREQGMRRWLQAALAGFAVGFGVMEGADVGAIFSLYAAAAIVFHSFNESENPRQGAVLGIARLVLVVVCAAWIASYTVLSLVSTQVQGITGTAQDAETKKQRWDYATQWSWPKLECVRFVIPGVYGYRMDTPDGGNYWGALGAPDGVPQGRHSGGGEYAGVMVVVVALWGIGRSLSKSGTPVYTPKERRWIWFWTVSAAVSLLLAFGRFAPFYQLIYSLPYFSTIRNPIKFLHPFHMSLLILFAYGLQGIWKRHLEKTVARKSGLVDQLKSWWATAQGYDATVRVAMVILAGASVAAAIVYGGSRMSLEKHLAEVGFPGEGAAPIAAFSIREVRLFAGVMIVTLASLAVTFSGWFSGAQSRKAWMLLSGVLLVDMVRSNTPWVMTYDASIRYQTNPIVEKLRQAPWQGRATAFLDPHRSFGLSNNRIFSYMHNEWLEHVFQYNRIQSLDIIQMPRVPELDAAYLAAMGPNRNDPRTLQQLWGALVQLPLLPTNQAEQVRSFIPAARTNFSIATRLWQLTNTRWLLGAAGLAPMLNEVLDPVRRPFREVMRFEFAPKNGVEPSNYWPLQHITAVETPTGSSALTEFTGALPRVKLYTQWEVITNDMAHLTRLVDPTFDPYSKVILTESIATASNPAAGVTDATLADYQGNRVLVKTKSDKPGVLLLNDRWDPNFRVTVNGKQAPLLRCNFIMRGVEVPAGESTVEFHFQPKMHSLYISLVALVAALGLCGILARASSGTEAVKVPAKA